MLWETGSEATVAVRGQAIGRLGPKPLMNLLNLSNGTAPEDRRSVMRTCLPLSEANRGAGVQSALVVAHDHSSPGVGVK